MEKSKEQILIDDGGIRTRCSEPGKMKCTGCGDASQTPDEWASNGNACQVCGGSPQSICARCEGILDATPLGEHPCHSQDVYRRTGKVIFAEEMILVAEERARREQIEQERAQRERAQRERAQRERAQRERAQRERAERERAERERAERERAERERAERERAERERAVREESSRSSGTLWKVIGGAIVGAVLAIMFVDKEADKSKVAVAQKPAETAKISAPETVHLVDEKLKAERETAPRRATFTPKKNLVFRRGDADSIRELSREDGRRSSYILDYIAQGADYQIADADLDGDGIPEVLISMLNCGGAVCNTYVFKQVDGADYQVISIHAFRGTIGITNEKICGFSALFDESKMTRGIVNAEPMNALPQKFRSQCKPGDENSKSVAVRPQVATPVAVQSPSEPVDLVRAALSAYQVTAVVPHLNAMASASKLGRTDVISQEVDAILNLSRPARGDRKIARAANDLGLAAMQQDAFDNAVSNFASGVKADPADQEIVDNLSSALLMSRRLPEAGKAAIASLLLNPMRASAWVNIAAVVAEDGKEDLAIASYQLAYRFSRNQETTREYLEKVKQEDASVLS